MHTNYPEANLGGISRGPKGRVGEGSPLLKVGVRASTRESFEKMKHNGAIWSANQAF